MSQTVIEELTKTVTDLRIAVELLKAEVNAIKEMKNDIQVLKDARQQQLGERTIMIAIAVFIGGILQSIATTFFGKH